MSKTLSLGTAPAQVVALEGSPGFPDAFATINAKGEKIVILTSLEEAMAYELNVAGLGEVESPKVEIIHAGRHGDGITPNEERTLKVSTEVAPFTVVLEPRSVAGLVIHP